MERKIDRTRVTDVEEISGHGITAKVDGVSVAAGNYKLMKKLGLSYSETDKVGTIVHIAIDGRYEGYILISDKIKPTSAAAIKALKKAGIKGTIMLTGDSRTVADSVAAELGIDEVYSELLPGDKVAKVEELLARKGSKEKARLRRRRNQRCTGALKSRYRNCNGRHGFRCSKSKPQISSSWMMTR